ncbi:MAG: MerR family transcriptional regulator [Candidatus Solibacter usitatus]|nr:MerR family transcriptional regulator [Candidatus Solibacter usitatus]
MIAETAVAQAPLARPEIPDKLYFRIGDVSRLTGIKSFVLRFWETEFPQLAPKKSGTGHRLYRRKDVEMVLEIKRLLYEERFTIEGARNSIQTRHQMARAVVKAKAKSKKPVAASTSPAVQADLFGSGIPLSALDDIRIELKSILGLLS